MVTQQQLELDLHDAMRNHNEIEKDVIKLILTSIRLFEIEQQKTICEEDLTRIIQKEVKIRNETLSEINGTERYDLEDKAKSELSILEKYLPSQLSDADLSALVSRVINECNAKALSDMGKVMKILIPLTKGQATPDRISSVVRSLLT